MLPPFQLQVNGITLCSLFASGSLYSSMLWHGAASHFLLPVCCPIVWICHNFFIHLVLGGHFSYFPFCLLWILLTWTLVFFSGHMHSFIFFLTLYIRIYGLPLRLSGKESACQCKRHGFDPWVRKIPWRRKWQPTPLFLPGFSMNKGAWWAIVNGVTKESGTT